MPDVCPAMEEARMGFIGIRPFAAGLLTDRRIDRGMRCRQTIGSFRQKFGVVANAGGVPMY
jgi:hypothetical protein